MAGFESVEHAQLAINELRSTTTLPSAIEMVDKYLLDQVQANNPNLISTVVQPPFPAVTLFIEYDANPERTYKKAVKRAERILSKVATNFISETDPAKQEHIWKLRQTSAWLLGRSENHRKAVPIIDDGIVPVEKFQDLMTGIYDMFAKEKMAVGVWGHAGDGNLHIAPMLNLSEVGDRQTAFRLLDEYTKLVLSLGGSTSGQNNDGRLRAPYLPQVFSPEVYALFKKVKLICDPYGTLNPGVKIDVKLEDIKPLVRGDFSLEHAYDHLPRS
jgi:FAD/FMN-containing dehydrogenase